MDQQVRIAEACASLRDKSPQSTTLQRAILTHEAWQLACDMPQPIRLGHILQHVLSRIDTPVIAHDLLLGRMPETIPTPAQETLFQECLRSMGGALPPGFTDGGHETFDWETLLQIGLSGIHHHVRDRRQRARMDHESQATCDFLEGMDDLCDAFRGYARRYARAACQAGLTEAADALAAVADKAPETFREALQLMWIVGLVTCCFVACNPTLTFGRVDQWLYPFYRRDLEAGRLTRTAAGDLIEDFYCKNNLILGRGEHQMSGPAGTCTGWERNLCYDAPQYIVLGGERATHRPDCTDLTDLFLERLVPRFENPYVVLRYWPDISPGTWALAGARLRANASMMVYNDGAVIPAFEHLGFPREQACEYTMHGCNWPDLPPSQILAHCDLHVLPETLLRALDAHPDCHDLEDLMACFRVAYRERVRHDADAFRDTLRRRRDAAPGPLAVDDLFLRGPIERARDKYCGGVDHVTTVTTFSSFATLVDSVAAIDALVFRDGRLALARLLAVVAENFSGQEALRHECLRAPKFGHGNAHADDLARRLMELMHEEVDAAAATAAGGGEAIYICRSLETDMNHIHRGARMGATPDGRRAGEPLSENSSPSRTVRSSGVTETLNSLAQLPLKQCHSGALNLRLSPGQFPGEAGIKALGNLLETYFRQGGLQAQLSMVDTDVLREAQQHPAQHRDLMVRITGYSAAFTDMSPGAQEEIIRRE